jgi:hypothetical protein
MQSVAVANTAGIYRLRTDNKVAGTNTWLCYSSNGTALSYAAYCDNARTFTNGDVMIVKDYVTVDASFTLGAASGTGDATYIVSAWICSNPFAPEKTNVCLLRWSKTPAASYTMSFGGQILMGNFSGFEAGNEQSATCTITNANPGVVTKASHGLLANQMVSFTTTGVLPNNLVSTQGFYYYVKNILSVDTFTVSATPGGAEIDTSGTQSGIHTIYWGRIPYAQQAIISGTNATSTAQAFTVPSMSSSSGITAGCSIIAYGQIPKFQFTTLTEQANTTDTSLVVSDSVDWVNGNQIVVGKQFVQGAGDLTNYTVNSVVGTTINTTGGMAVNNRMVGAKIIRFN